MDLANKHAHIQSKKDLAEFIAVFRDDLRTNPAAWENADLESFLDAMQSWVEAMENYYKNHGRDMPEPPTWQVFADILMGARIYE